MSALNLGGPVFRPSGAGTGGAGAAGHAQVGALFKKFRESSPDSGAIWGDAIENESAKRQQAMAADSSVESQRLINEANIDAAQISADAKKEAQEAQSGGSFGGSLIKTGLSVAGGLLFGSDKSIKNNIEDLEDALATLRGLKPVTFYYNEEYACGEAYRLQYGFIAQEYQKVMPDATYHDTRINKLTIDTAQLIPLLVSAIQKLESRVTRMEAANVLEKV